jgi:hypothetical protein
MFSQEFPSRQHDTDRPCSPSRLAPWAPWGTFLRCRSGPYPGTIADLGMSARPWSTACR